MKLKRDFRKELIPIKLCAIAFIQLIGGWKQSRRVKNGMHVSCYDYGKRDHLLLFLFFLFKILFFLSFFQIKTRLNRLFKTYPSTYLCTKKCSL